MLKFSHRYFLKAWSHFFISVDSSPPEVINKPHSTCCFHRVKLTFTPNRQHTFTVSEASSAFCILGRLNGTGWFFRQGPCALYRALGQRYDPLTLFLWFLSPLTPLLGPSGGFQRQASLNLFLEARDLPEFRAEKRRLAVLLSFLIYKSIMLFIF